VLELYGAKEDRSRLMQCKIERINMITGRIKWRN